MPLLIIFLSSMWAFCPIQKLSAQSQQGVLLGTWADFNIPPSTQFNNTFNEVWGFERNGHEFAVIGSTMGTHIVDITDLNNIYEAAFVKGASAGNWVSHRDFHEFNGYLYAVCGQNKNEDKSSLQIIDVRMLPDSFEVVYNSDEYIQIAHNIFIDTLHSRLYACSSYGTTSGYASISILDIRNPEKPELLASYNSGTESFAISSVHDVYVKEHIAYLNVGGAGLYVVNFTDPDNPEILYHLSNQDFPEPGYNHSGWLSEDGRYYYFGNENHGGSITVLEVSDPRNIKYISSFKIPDAHPLSIPHNQIVHCGHLYVSYYFDGLQVFDLSQPESPQSTLYYPTTVIQHFLGFVGAWGVYPFLSSGKILVSDMHKGLFIVQSPESSCFSLTQTTDLQEAGPQLKFQNPNNGHFIIQTSQSFDHLDIFDLHGYRIWGISNVPQGEVNVRIEKPGVYFIRMLNRNRSYTEKLIIHRD